MPQYQYTIERKSREFPIASYPCIIDKTKLHIGAYGGNYHNRSFLTLEYFRCANGNVIEIILAACAGQKFALQTIRCNNPDV